MRVTVLIVRSLAVALLVGATAAPAAAQNGRVGGTVKDESGQPIKGATVTADYLDASANSVVSTTDKRGRFAMVGLRFGEWMFVAGAPGFLPSSANLNVRTIGANPSLTFALTKVFVPPSALGSLAPKDLQAALAGADALYNAQKWDEAVAAYREILAQAPSLSVINLQIASAYRSTKAYDEAIAAYGALLKIDPDNDKAKAGIAMTHLEKGDIEAAEQILDLAARGPEAAREVLLGLGEVKLAKSQTDEAVRAFERAAAADPAWGKPRLALGRIALTMGAEEAAARYFQQVLDVDPTSPEAAQATTLLRQLRR